MRAAALAIGAALVPAGLGCGGSQDKYTLPDTRDCLSRAGMTVSVKSPRGLGTEALSVRRGTYYVYIAFEESDSKAKKLAEAVETAAPLTFRDAPLEDVVFQRQNAVYFAQAVEFPDPAKRQIEACLS